MARQRSKWTDSTVCRSSALTLSEDAKGEKAVDHEANAIDVEDPHLVVPVPPSNRGYAAVYRSRRSSLAGRMLVPRCPLELEVRPAIAIERDVLVLRDVNRRQTREKCHEIVDAGTEQPLDRALRRARLAGVFVDDHERKAGVP